GGKPDRGDPWSAQYHAVGRRHQLRAARPRGGRRRDRLGHVRPGDLRLRRYRASMRAGRRPDCRDRARMNLWELSAAELTAGYGSGEFSPRDALEAVLARIDAVNPKINAIVTCDADGARRAADASATRWR